MNTFSPSALEAKTGRFLSVGSRPGLYSDTLSVSGRKEKGWGRREEKAGKIEGEVKERREEGKRETL